MIRIHCGAATATVDLDHDRVADARLGGLLLPANAGALSARILEAGVDKGALGVLADVRGALVALPKIEAPHYGYVPYGMLSVPVALVVTPEQLSVYAQVAQAAADRGTIRRAFLSRQEAQEWLLQQARALVANQVWWSARRSPP